jgi:hypothetical protein
MIALFLGEVRLHNAFIKLSVKTSNSEKYLPEKLQFYTAEKNL